MKPNITHQIWIHGLGGKVGLRDLSSDTCSKILVLEWFMKLLQILCLVNSLNTEFVEAYSHATKEKEISIRKLKLFKNWFFSQLLQNNVFRAKTKILTWQVNFRCLGMVSELRSCYPNDYCTMYSARALPAFGYKTIKPYYSKNIVKPFCKQVRHEWK